MIGAAAALLSGELFAGFKEDMAAAEKGDANAQFKVGNHYSEKDDYINAAIWWFASAKQGHAEAQNRLGECYYYGRGVKHDYAEALKWLEEAADQDDAAAQCNLGIYYYDGKGAKKNYSRAVRWWKKSAKQNYPEAMYRLDVILINNFIKSLLILLLLDKVFIKFIMLDIVSIE